ncbi:MAG TPA: hypothetical protein VFR48_08220 [Solirubrobacteraceae bacterium]|nr:hypothetical protein [Solirubrobacteraceae bacterium]
MNEFLQSLRSDLLSRRMLPLLALAVLALAVGIGYALGGTGSTPAPRPSLAAGGSSEQASLTVVAAAANPNAAESETPGGIRYQSGGAARNPFTPLPEAKSATAKTSGSSSSGSSNAGGSSGSSGSSNAGGSSGSSGGSGSGGKSGGIKPAPTPPKHGKPSKKAAYSYDVSILFGKLPAAPGQEVTLPPYQNLQPQRPIPSSNEERIALERVNGNAKSAIFTLLAPAILRGEGMCLPSPSECQHLSLEVGHAEELEYVEENGQSFVYELKTVSIVKSSSQTAG